jgi:hypothetical protein
MAEYVAEVIQHLHSMCEVPNTTPKLPASVPTNPWNDEG